MSIMKFLQVATSAMKSPQPLTFCHLHQIYLFTHFPWQYESNSSDVNYFFLHLLLLRQAIAWSRRALATRVWL